LLLLLPLPVLHLLLRTLHGLLLLLHPRHLLPLLLLQLPHVLLLWLRLPPLLSSNLPLLLRLPPPLLLLLLHLLRGLLQPKLQHIHSLPTNSCTTQQAAPRIAAAPMLLTNAQQRQRAKVAAAWPLQPWLLQRRGNLPYELPSSE
jgi:hypothetical protein